MMPCETQDEVGLNSSTRALPAASRPDVCVRANHSRELDLPRGLGLGTVKTGMSGCSSATVSVRLQ